MGIRCETGYGVTKRASLDSPDFDVVYADSVLKIAIAWKPGDQGRRACDIGGLDTGWTQGSILSDDHGAGSVF